MTSGVLARMAVEQVLGAAGLSMAGAESRE